MQDRDKQAPVLGAITAFRCLRLCFGLGLRFRLRFGLRLGLRLRLGLGRNTLRWVVAVGLRLWRLL